MVAVRKNKQHDRPHQYQVQGQTRPANYDDVDGSPGVIDWIINAVVHVMTFIPVTLAKLLNPFVERGGVGLQALGAIAFLAGVLVGADNFYQGFTGKAILPWFTEAELVHEVGADLIFTDINVTGLLGVLSALFSLSFLFALAFSLLTQFIQGRAVRGRSLEHAQSEFLKWNQPTMPGKPDPNKKLDMAEVSWAELKKTGKNNHQFIRFIAIALWASEFIAAFAAHNPLNYTGRAGAFLMCTVYALATVVAGETGYSIYCAAKEESSQS